MKAGNTTFIVNLKGSKNILMNKIKPDKVKYNPSRNLNMRGALLSPVFMNQYTSIPISGDIVKSILRENEEDIKDMKK